MIVRNSLLTAAALLALAAPAFAADTPGVTATEIKIGNTMPYSGPASAYGVIGKAESAFFKMVNDQGGVDGRKINFISLDDGYSPPKTVEQVRQLVEQDGVAFIFNTLGTPPNSAIAEIPQPEEGAAAVRRHRRRQVGQLQEVPLDHRLAAELPHRGADLRQIHPQGEARRQDRHPLPERRFR